MLRRASLLLVLLACTDPGSNVIESGFLSYKNADLKVVATGDTLRVTQYFTPNGNADSVRWTFSARNSPSRILSRTGLFNGVSTSVGPALIIPSPPLNEGDTITVSACPQAWKKNQSFTSACATKLYTKPIVPPTITNDSTTVIGLDIYPKGTLLTAKATTACLQAYAQGTGLQAAWTTTWDNAANDWKPVCKRNGVPMIAAYCVAVVFKDTVAMRAGPWNVTPWCRKFDASVPTRLSYARQKVVDSLVIQFSSRMTGGLPYPGWSFDDPFLLTAMRDTTTDVMPNGFIHGFFAYRFSNSAMYVLPNSENYVVARIYNFDGTPRVGAPVTWTTS